MMYKDQVATSGTDDTGACAGGADAGATGASEQPEQTVVDQDGEPV